MLGIRSLLQTCALACIAGSALAVHVTHIKHVPADGPDPMTALRPALVEGLSEDLYPYIGSYYNGTMTLVIEPTDFVSNTTCDTFTDGPVTIIYVNSVLAITQSPLMYWQDDISKAEPLAFTLNYWNNDTDVRNFKRVSMSYDNDVVQSITSLSDHVPDFTRVDQSVDNKIPEFHFNSTFNADTSSYSFAGYRNSSYRAPQQLIHFNHSQCESPEPVVFDGGLIEPGYSWLPRLVPNATDYPRVSAQFDNKTASFEIKATVGTDTASRGTGQRSYLGGNIKIRFEGKLDEVRSDVLWTNPNNGTPIWKATLGFERNLNGTPIVIEKSGSAVVRSEWTLGVVLLVGFFVFISV